MIGKDGVIQSLNILFSCSNDIFNFVLTPDQKVLSSASCMSKMLTQHVCVRAHAAYGAVLSPLVVTLLLNRLLGDMMDAAALPLSASLDKNLELLLLAC